MLNLIAKVMDLDWALLWEQSQGWQRCQVMLVNTAGTALTEQASLQTHKPNSWLFLELLRLVILENTIENKFKTWFMARWLDKTSYLNMEESFTARVESRWNYLRGAPCYSHIVSASSRPSPSRLIINIQTNETTATITASKQLSTLELTVHRYKKEQLLFRGSCSTNSEIDRRLQSLLIDLSASPFA